MNRPLRLPSALAALALLVALAAAPARADRAPSRPAPTSPAGEAPVLKVEQAVYRLDQNVLEMAFTFHNPTDSVLFLDCEVQPTPTRMGSILRLDFTRAGLLNPDSARPQRIGARQGYRGHRRVWGLGPDTSGASLPGDPAGATTVAVEMAAYPERSEGEGTPWVLEKGFKAAAEPVPLKKTGKRPKASRIRIEK